MKYLQMIVDNSTSVLAWLTALFGLLVLFGLDLTDDQLGGVMVFAGATIGLLAAIVTTAKRTVVTSVDSSGVIRAGAAATAPTGSATPVIAEPATGNLIPQVAVNPSLL